MFPFWSTSFTLVLISVGIWQYSKRKKSLETQKVLIDFFQDRLDQIKNINLTFSEFLHLTSGYFTNYQLVSWLNENQVLYDEIIGKPFEKINLPEESVRVLRSFLNYYENGELIRNDFNNRFVHYELENYQDFFDNIEGRKLDRQQRLSIIKDEDNQLVVAGAGAGKTTTIVGKVRYIIARYNIKPEEILMISFTRKSSSDLSKRIDVSGLDPKTFHKLGLHIITEFEGEKPSIYDENQFMMFVKQTFKNELKDVQYLEKVVEYFLTYLKIEKSPFEFKTQGEYIQYLKDQNFRSYKLKKILFSGKVTMQREVVKSVEECKIANFLFFNDIEYEYEHPYEYQTSDKNFSQYKPDFTIKQGNKVIYLEHFGIDRNGNIPKFFVKENETYDQAKSRYRQKIKWAKHLHKEKDTDLIEVYSYQMKEGTLFASLKKELTSRGVVFKLKSPSEIMKVIDEVAEEEVNAFVTLVSTFITLMKSNNYSIKEVISKNNYANTLNTHIRNEKFIGIVQPIFKKYQEYLLQTNQIDFSDMTNKAANLIKEKNYYKKYKYIIVDEFQDTSIGRYQLLKAIRDSNKGSKVYCVGDDWQSIYRFSGSDISLFNKFEEYFGYTEKSKIETTYRFHQPLIDISGEFIQKNLSQIPKKLNSTLSNKKTNYYLKYYLSNPLVVLNEIFDELIRDDPKIAEKDIFLLGRYSFDLVRLVREDSLLENVRTFKNENITIDFIKEMVIYNHRLESGDEIKLVSKFITAHRSKGLESDVVIILNCNSGKYGFPSEVSDDPVLKLLLAGTDNHENAEERRLFYVAMTRAKEKVYMMSNTKLKSKFITELDVDNSAYPNTLKCPRCKTSDLVMRKSGQAVNGNSFEFYGCSNYLFGCDYTDTKWL